MLFMPGFGNFPGRNIYCSGLAEEIYEFPQIVHENLTVNSEFCCGFCVELFIII